MCESLEDQVTEMKNIDIKTIEFALANNEFFLSYQPKISMLTGQLCGAEALLRWRTSDGQTILPGAFIPMAEDAGIITDITRRVFDILISDLPDIIALNSDLRVSFNVSGQDFCNQGFTEYVVQKIKQSDKYINNIEIEVTESVLLDESRAKSSMHLLADLGIHFSMDDFGTGHSSLVELSKWPFSTVKIDKAIVNGIYESKKFTEILQAALRLAHQLDLEVVAEGIEDKYTYDLLQKYGCKIGQGFWISRPLKKDNFLSFIKKHQPKETFPTGIIYMAQLDHLQWKKTLIDSAMHIHRMHSCEDMKTVQGGLPKLSHLECKLGQWYYSANQYFGHLSEYKSIEEPHRELHEIGNNLIKAAANNCSNHELKCLIMILSKKSMKIMELLQDLSNYWVLYEHMQNTQIKDIKTYHCCGVLPLPQ